MTVITAPAGAGAEKSTSPSIDVLNAVATTQAESHAPIETLTAILPDVSQAHGSIVQAIYSNQKRYFFSSDAEFTRM